MTHPKNAKDQTQYPQIIIAAMAISIAATTFVDHPLGIQKLFRRLYFLAMLKRR